MYGLIDDVVILMNNEGYNNNYDEFILAGASLGYNQEIYSEWRIVLNKHIELAIQLHDIQEIIIIDHMNCCVYKIFYNNQNLLEEDEKRLHIENLNKFKILINTTIKYS